MNAMDFYKRRYIYIALVLIAGIAIMAISIDRLMESVAVSNISSSLSEI